MSERIVRFVVLLAFVLVGGLFISAKTTWVTRERAHIYKVLMGLGYTGGSNQCLLELDNSDGWNFMTGGDAECFLHWDGFANLMSHNIPYPGLTTNAWNRLVLQCEANGPDSGRRCVNDIDCTDDAACTGGVCNCETRVTNAHVASTAVMNVKPEGVWLKKRGGDAEKGTVVLTFDDGAESQYTDAWPLMRERSIEGTFCMSTGFFGWDLPYINSTNCAPNASCEGGDGPGGVDGEQRITEAQARAWILEGADLQSHGHKELATGDCSGVPCTYRDDILPDLNTNVAWMLANFGYEPNTYCVPGGSWDYRWSINASGFFDVVRSSTAGWQPESGLLGFRDGGWRYFTNTVFASTAAEDADAICDFVQQGLLADPGATFNFGFHGFSAAGQSIAPNEYPIDEFEDLLDCLAYMRDQGQIDVLPVDEAMRKAKLHTGATYNLLTNPRFATWDGSTTHAAQWNKNNQTLTGLTFEQNTDAWQGRQARYVQQSGSVDFLEQLVTGLEIGKQYVFAADIEWENYAPDPVDRQVKLRVLDWSGHGAGQKYNEPGKVESPYMTAERCESGAGLDAERFCMSDANCQDDAGCSGGVCNCENNGTDGDRGVAWVQFNATAETMTVGMFKVGHGGDPDALCTAVDTPEDCCTGSGTGDCAQQLIVRYPRVIQVNSAGGNNSYAQVLDYSGIQPFRITRRINGNAALATSTTYDDSFPVLQYYRRFNCGISGGSGNCEDQDTLGTGPTKFMLTRLRVVGDPSGSDSPITPTLTDVDVEFYDRANGSGTKLYEVTGIDLSLGAFDTQGNMTYQPFALMLQDKDSSGDYWSSNEGLGNGINEGEWTGNQIHVRVVNNDGVNSEIVSVTVEGFIVN